MNVKTIVYILIIAVFLTASLTLLGLYYTQDFDVKISFKDTLSYENIRLNSDSGILNNAKAEVGQIIIKNNGFFTTTYNYPQIFGCINLKENIKSNYSSEIEGRIINIYEGELDSENYYYNSNKNIKIKVGEEKKIKLIGNYEGNYNIPVRELSKDKIDSISIYIIEKKEDNPIGFDYNYRYYGSCDSLKADEEADEEIIIV